MADEDTQSVVSSNSDLYTQRSNLTQQQIDAVRGFVQSTKDVIEYKRRIRESAESIKKHNTVLLELLNERQKSRLVIDAETKIHLAKGVVVKKASSKQLLHVINSTLEAEGAEVFGRVTKRVERDLKELQVQVRKEQLTLKQAKSKKSLSTTSDNNA